MGSIYNMKVMNSRILWYLTLVLTHVSLIGFLYSKSKNSCLNIRLDQVFPTILKLNVILKPPVHVDSVSFCITMTLHNYD